MYYRLVKNIEKLRADPITGIEFEHKLMVKWGSNKKGGSIGGENKNAVTYSTFEDDNGRFKEKNKNFMKNTSAYQDMLAEYEAVMEEERRVPDPGV